jgi:hypothetical protein
MNVKDAVSKYAAARAAAFAANAVTVQTAFEKVTAKRELEYNEAQVILSTDDFARAVAAHESADGMERWANDSLTIAKANLAKATRDNVPNRNVPRVGGAS